MRTQMNLRRMQEQARGKKFIIFGGGEACEKFYHWYHSFFDIAYIIDNNCKLQGQKLHGVEVFSPDKLKDENAKEIVVLVCVKAAILPVQQLIDLDIPDYNIYVMVNNCFVNVSDNGNVNDFVNMLLRVETTTLCNFECSFCLSVRNSRPHNATMEKSLYEKTIREGYEIGFRKLDLRGYGEPLMDDDFEDKVRFAKTLGYEEIFAFTNASFLTEERYLSCANAGLSYFIVSISPRREFEKTRGIPYETVTDMLFQLKDTNRKKCPVYIHIVTEGTDIADLQACKQEMEAMRFPTTYVDVYKGPYSVCHSKESFMPCFRAFECVTVFYDGKVSGCGFDLEKIICVGDLTKMSLADTVNSETFCQFRAAHLKNPMKSCMTCDLFKFRFNQ